MSAARSTVRTRRIRVPEQVAAAEQGLRADYSTAVRLDGGPAMTPEQWARGCLEGVPGWLRLGLVFGWTAVLRLRLGPRRTPATVLGWTVLDSSDGKATLAADSPLLDARHHFVREGGSITWVTAVHTHTRVGAMLWRVIAPVHELSMPLLMKHAAARLR